ncbi:hypothetical protein BC828DRAFT_399617 [Blastocladiella britannica]|nr:hypothetical protein BC828DRAFT_399617 [Blastocladiella britannica]
MQNLFGIRRNTTLHQPSAPPSSSAGTDHDPTSIGLISQPIGPPPPPGLRPLNTAHGNDDAVTTTLITTPTEAASWLYRSTHGGSHVLLPVQESTSNRRQCTIGRLQSIPDTLSLVASGPDPSPTPTAVTSDLVNLASHVDKDKDDIPPSSWQYRVFCIVAPLLVVVVAASLSGFVAHSTMQADLATVNFTLSSRCMQLASQIENDLNIRVVDQMAFVHAFLTTSPSFDRQCSDPGHIRHPRQRHALHTLYGA